MKRNLRSKVGMGKSGELTAINYAGRGGTVGCLFTIKERKQGYEIYKLDSPLFYAIQPRTRSQ